VLTSDVHFDEIGETMIDELETEIPTIDFTYDTTLAEHTVTFAYPTAEGNQTLAVRVAHGHSVPDPVASGEISPYKNPTVENTFAFSGWDASLDNITANVTINATFSSFVRRYTVNFLSAPAAGQLLQTSTVAAHGTVRYNGEDLEAPTAHVWAGWSDVTNDVVADMNVYAVFYAKTEPTSYPASGTHTYLYSDDPNDDMAYNFGEFWYICDTLDAAGDPLARTYFLKGDRIKMVFNTSAFTDTAIIHQLEAFKHFKTADGIGWGNTFWGMVGIMNTTRAMRNSAKNNGGYDGADSSTEYTLARWLENTVYPNMPPHWRALIPAMRIPSSAGNQSSDIVYSSKHVFLRSESEVFGDTITPYVNEVEYDGTVNGADELMFTLYNSATARRKATNNGTGTYTNYWLRSPAAASSSAFCFVNTNGAANTNVANTAYGVSWGFCFGSKTA
ncbi:MAG: hypothetical protein IJV64_02635, partial [Oscillospiraceae bacterium]|nr:hypothetical protein [Oscillospiraceae bacterium]